MNLLHNTVNSFTYRAEFRVVYNGIYSDEVEPKRQAMEKMLTWQSRYIIKLLFFSVLGY